MGEKHISAYRRWLNISSHCWKKNKCVLENILLELSALRSYILPIIENNKSEHYLDLWKKIFTNNAVKQDCKNILYIFEILLITPFTNAKVERGFSRMARVKTDYRNRLKRTRLDACLQISEEGIALASFNPDPAIDVWYGEKVWRLTSTPHRYPKNRERQNKSEKVLDIATITLSDLEDSEEEEIQWE